jgi:hypothetical protein
MIGRTGIEALTRAMMLATVALTLATSGSPARAQLPAAAERAYSNYQKEAANRAFALAADGKGYFWVDVSGPDPAPAVDKALSSCREKSGDVCRLYAINNVVLSGADWKSAAPPQLPPIGGLRAPSYWHNSGPQTAAGLVVWSHGYRHGRDSTGVSPQAIVSYFADQGYDYYRYDRQWIDDKNAEINLLAESVWKARAMGYRRVVLAGQSHGAWASLGAAGKGAPVDAVISVSAAAHGEVAKMSDVSRARSDWQQLVRAIRPGPKVVVVIFDKDAFDVGGRMGDAKTAFAGSGVDAVLIDSPPGFAGHSAGATRGFWQRYGACVTAFTETGRRDAPCN